MLEERDAALDFLQITERMKGGPRAAFFKRVVLAQNQDHNGHAGIKEGEAKE